MSCAFGIAVVPSGEGAAWDVGGIVGMGHLLTLTVYEILEMGKILETGRRSQNG
jgi:hypothetical protein